MPDTQHIQTRSVHLYANMTERDIRVYVRDTSIHCRCRVPPNTIPSENDKEASLHACSPPQTSGKLQIDGVRILFKFARQNENERERGKDRQRKTRRKRDANLQFQNIPASPRAKKGVPRKEEERRDLNPFASSSSRRNCYFNSTFCH